ncbi:hypothetical protein FRX31_031063 [Thalictrum thalictroides]|uniref:Uncharacterized protein n=1 Tax=Thalictrum thalictroides TaxID=46969 RepID=A0A7J6V2V5_THATH|nr:hypothetical protein FRX31_031063 [Thalictrum thalictroides]
MIYAVSSGGDPPHLIDEAVSEIEATAINNRGYPHAQSVFGTGQLKEKSASKAFLHHHFAFGVMMKKKKAGR